MANVKIDNLADEIMNGLKEYADLATDDLKKSVRKAGNTVRKDIAVLVQNYSLPRKPQSNEDFSSMLIDLDLIRQNSEGKGYYFNIEGKRKVTKEIFMYALLKLKEREGDNTLSYDTVQDEIGLAFCMQDYETIEMLKLLAKDYSEYVSYNDNAGIRIVQFTKELSKEQVLNDYYNAHI